MDAPGSAWPESGPEMRIEPFERRRKAGRRTCPVGASPASRTYRSAGWGLSVGIRSSWGRTDHGRLEVLGKKYQQC